MNTTDSNVTNSNVTDSNVTDGKYEYTGFTVSIIPYVVSLDAIAGLGVIGNMLTIVLMTSSELRRKSFAVYMIFLAVSDTIVLITIATEDTTDHIFNVLYMLEVDVVFCKLWNTIDSWSTLVSPWLLVAMTFDRLILVVFPLHKGKFCRKKVALIICVVICTVGFILASPFLYYMTPMREDDGSYDCDMDNDSVKHYDMILLTIMNAILPVCVLVVFNIKTIVVLRRISASALARSTSGRSPTRTKFLKITASLVLVSVLSTIALVPFSINALVEYVLQVTHGDPYAHNLAGSIWMVLNVVRLLNYAMNFYVLVIFYDQYRIILWRMLTCAENTRGEEVKSSSTFDRNSQDATTIDSCTVEL